MNCSANNLNLNPMTGRLIPAICGGLLLLAICGCSSLSSLGIPVGNSSNKLLSSAKKISEAPSQAVLTSKELQLATLDSLAVDVGDTVSVEPVSFDATIRLPGDQTVKPDGRISLGEFGPFFAAGKSVEQLQLEIQSLIDSSISSRLETEFALQQQRTEQQDSDELVLDGPTDDEQDKDVLQDQQARDRAQARQARRAFDDDRETQLRQNRISVRLTNWDSKKIYVLGEVNSPGSFVYQGNETVLDAIIEAGGIGTKANHHAIIVSRPSNCGDCKTVMKVCYDQIVQLGDASTNYQLLPGDRVYVPSLSFMEDLRQTLRPFRNDHCPRCAPGTQGCDLPQGCQ